MFRWEIIDALQRKFILVLNTANQDQTVAIAYQHNGDEEHQRGERFLRGMIGSSYGIHGHSMDHRFAAPADLHLALLVLERKDQLASQKLVQGEIDTYAPGSDEDEGWQT